MNVNRERSTINYRSYLKFDEGSEEREILKIFMVGIEDNFKSTERTRVTIAQMMSKIGGLYNALFIIITIITT